jgi:hypothetical protein
MHQSYDKGADPGSIVGSGKKNSVVKSDED